MICALVAFTPGGAALGKRLADALGGTLHVPARLAQSTGMPPYDSLEAWTASHWETGRALVFIGAAGSQFGRLRLMSRTSSVIRR